MEDTDDLNSIELATELTIAWLGNQNNRVQAGDVPAFLREMHATVMALAGEKNAAPEEPAEEMPQQEHAPAVTVRKSLASKEHIVSLIDGKPYKTLRRHLTTHGLTPDEYRARYNLKPDYPMVAPNYSEARRAMAHQIGLGSKGRDARAKSANAAAPEEGKRRGKTPAPAATSETAAAAPKRGRPRKQPADAQA